MIDAGEVIRIVIERVNVARNSISVLDELQDASEVVVDRALLGSLNITRLSTGFLHVRRDNEWWHAKAVYICLTVTTAIEVTRMSLAYGVDRI